MNTKKKIPSIAEQAQAAGDSFIKWGRGEKRLRTTIATRDGKSSIAYTTRPELEAKLREAEIFKRYRAELGMSQPQFARLIHSTSSAIKQWETGRRAIPATVRALAELARNIPAARRHLEATAEPSATSAVTSTRKRV